MSYFKRAVNLNDQNLQNGDYCSVHVVVSNGELREAVAIDAMLVVYNRKAWMLTDNRCFNGSLIEPAVLEEIGLRYSWELSGVCSDDSFRYFTEHCGDATFISIEQRARRVSLNETNLQPFDYCNVQMRQLSTGNILNAQLFLDREKKVYLLSNNAVFWGQRHNEHLPYELKGWTYSYVLIDIDEQTPTIFSVYHLCISSYAIEELDPISIIERPQDRECDIPTELISKNYQKEHTYNGFHLYHAHHGHEVNLPLKRYTHRIGVELEVEFGSSRKRETFTDIKTNWFYCERDGSLGSNGCEIITIPLHPNDAKSHEFWKPLCDTLVSLEAKSWDTSTCGCHVHIGREILGSNDDEKSQTLGKLLYFYHEYLKDALGNCKIYGRTHGYHDTICKTEVSTAVKILGSSVLKDKEVREKLDKSMKGRSQTTRYFDINVMNSATIEFRKGRGSLNPERIAMIVEWSELIVSYAKFTHWKNISMETFKTFIKMKSGLSQMTMKYIEDYFA